MAKTERVPATCAVKEGAEGAPFLIFEAADMPSLPKVCFGVDLESGNDGMAEASEFGRPDQRPRKGHPSALPFRRGHQRR